MERCEKKVCKKEKQALTQPALLEMSDLRVYQDLPKIVGLEQFKLAPGPVGGAKIGGTAGPIEPNDRRADFGHRAGREETTRCAAAG